MSMRVSPRCGRCHVALTLPVEQPNYPHFFVQMTSDEIAGPCIEPETGEPWATHPSFYLVTLPADGFQPPTPGTFDFTEWSPEQE